MAEKKLRGTPIVMLTAAAGCFALVLEAVPASTVIDAGELQRFLQGLDR